MTARLLGSFWGLAGLALVACGSDGDPAGSDPNPDELGGEAGADRGPDSTEGGDAGAGGTAAEPDCATNFQPEGGADESGPGCITTDVPAGTFLIAPLDVEDPGQQFTQLGPWLMSFRMTAPGKLEAAVISSHSPLWAVNGFEAAGFELEANEHGVYRLAPHSYAKLATFAYASARAPGICLHNGRVAIDSSRAERDSEFRFYDTSADGLADVVTLRGMLVTAGLRGGDYDVEDCGEEPLALHTDGALIDWPIDVRADGDALHARLLLDGGFLSEGVASVVSSIEATPLSESGFIYGFAATKALEPGGPLNWRVEGVDSLGRPFSSFDENVSFGTVEPWLAVTDGTFETFSDGQRWGDGNASASSSFYYPLASLDLPPIEGQRSLHLNAQDGAGTRFRFVRNAGQTKLTFSMFGAAHVEVALVGHEPTSAFQRAPGDCDQHAAFCAATAAAGGFTKYSIELEPGTEDVLLSIQDRSGSFSTEGGGGVWIDELRLEP